MDDQNIDPKIIAKLKKMLALAQHGTANEGEADNAARIAQQIMLEHNISMAQVDSASDAPAGAARKKSVDEGNAKYAFQRNLMAACADVNFVYQEVNWKYGAYKRATGYTLIGREANVVAAKMLFEYLFATVDRLGLDYVNGDVSLAIGIAANSFKEGCADRLGERLRERHRVDMAEQARRAREANVAAKHPSSSGTALTVVMDDYAQDEKDRNEDLRLGRPEGATAHKRLMGTKRSEVESAIDNAFIPLRKTVGDRDVLIQAAKAAVEAMMLNRGWSMDEELQKIFDYELARSINWHMDVRKEQARWDKMTPLQRQRENEKEDRANARYWNSQRRYGSSQKAPCGVDQAAYSAGSRAGESVGLDAQVGATKRDQIK